MNDLLILVQPLAVPPQAVRPLAVDDPHLMRALSEAAQLQIVVVDHGEIIECGTPEELMALKGKYYKLIEIQSMGEQLQKKKAAENFE